MYYIYRQIGIYDIILFIYENYIPLKIACHSRNNDRGVVFAVRYGLYQLHLTNII